ncbi:hypothetical protein SODALDRAFT_379930 [Sodiomyces alkalinus F11]|uniref:C3H1-type domain-containing protein n=1 Tax=Sodiomyces alkalinus (strain CBS 110278 / VKM F-3762 / F11) TaxID=1314773 RepID=A0A3N2PSS9_SODAK|nr:hypothetical protein SODALDRAFT_379930 [Sodiomyces alkalinus F11]ROT37474.1 hypothetical protein SODALDRAFT_379930 [Sodiomyces alkalinus F11]
MSFRVQSSGADKNGKQPHNYARKLEPGGQPNTKMGPNSIHTPSDWASVAPIQLFPSSNSPTSILKTPFQSPFLQTTRTTRTYRRDIIDPKPVLGMSSRLLRVGLHLQQLDFRFASGSAWALIEALDIVQPILDHKRDQPPDTTVNSTQSVTTRHAPNPKNSSRVKTTSSYLLSVPNRHLKPADLSAGMFWLETLLLLWYGALSTLASEAASLVLRTLYSNRLWTHHSADQSLCTIGITSTNQSGLAFDLGISAHYYCSEMQNWSSNGQPVSGPGQGQGAVWTNTYSFNDGAGGFDAHQDFSQEGNPVSLPGQPVYGNGQAGERAASAESGLFGTSYGVQPGISDCSSLPAASRDGAFYAGTDPHSSLNHGHAQYGVNETFPRPGQNQTLQGLNDISPKLYGNPVNVPQGHGSAFSQTPYQYQPQHLPSPYSNQLGQHTGSQLVSHNQQQPPQQQSTHPQLQLEPHQPAQTQSHQPQHHHQQHQQHHHQHQHQQQQQQQQQQQHSLYQQPQRFDTIPQSFSPIHAFPQQQQHQVNQSQQAQQAQQQRVQPQPSRQQPQQQLPTAQSPPIFFGPPQPYHGQTVSAQPVNPQNVQAYAYHHQPSAPGHLQEQTAFVPQQTMYRQPTSPATFQPSPMRQSIEQEVQQQQDQQPRQQTTSAAGSHLMSRPVGQRPMAATSPPGPGTPDANTDTTQAEHPAKRRKTLVKNEGEGDSANSQQDQVPTELHSGAETHWMPTSTEEEAASLAQFKRRSAAAKKMFPPISGAPFLISAGAVKLPTPRSYDRLTPMVALPSQTGKRIMPDLGYPLPCEIQGNFADRYRPSANFVGKPEDREMEAKALIDEYQREMKGLGNRRPKYADYPFAFQEQLKADEAAKSKAQRKARKEEEEERRRPVRADVRPSDPVEAAAWDILGIAYIDPAATRTNSLIASAVQSLGEYFIKLRGEMSKLKQEIDQAAKEKHVDGEVVQLKKDYDLKKDVVVKACEAAHKYGDEAVLENLGGHQKGVLSLVNLLIGCIKAADYSGELPKAILQFMTNISLTKRIADGVNFETVRKRFADKGDAEVKDLIRTVASRIRKESEASNGAEGKKLSSTSSSSAATSTSTTTPSAASSTTSAAATSRTAYARILSATRPSNGASPAKRPQDDEPDTRPGKKVNVDGSSSSLSSKLGSSKASAGTTLQSKLSAPKIRPPSTSLAAKNRPLARPAAGSDSAKTTDATKTDGSAVSAAMDIDARPSSRTEPKRVKTEATKPATTPKTAGPSGSSSGALSSIGSLLDSINMPKADGQSSQKSSAKAADTAETPEEKAKRLRKEARRKLRVAWRPEAELVQVRIFHKEAAEDENNMTQDAADDRSEGMMLKRRSEMTDEEEDEEDQEDDLADRPWVEPGVADCSCIPEDYRAKSFVTRGGTRTFRTDEQHAMEEREQKELMAVYALVSDIPPTPKSPPPEPSVPDGDAKDVHLPRDGGKYEEIRQRWQECQRHGADAAVYHAIKRLKDHQDDPAVKLQSLLSGFKTTASTEAAPEGYNYNMTPPQQHAQPVVFGSSGQPKPPAASEAPFGAQVLALLTADKVGSWRDPEPYHSSAPRTHRRHDYADPELQAIINSLEEVFEQLKGLPYPATQPPGWLANDQERVREWWAGYQKDATARAKKEAENRARAEAAVNVQQAAAASFVPPQQGQGQGQAVPTHQDAWAAYYQQMLLQQQQQQDEYAQYMALLQQAQGAHAQQATTQTAAALLGAQSGQLGDAQLQALLSQINQPQPEQVGAALQGGSQGHGLDLDGGDGGYQKMQDLSSGGDQATGYYGREWDDKQDHGYDSRAALDYGSERDRDVDPPWDRDRRDSRERDRDDRETWREKHAGAKGGRKGNAPGGPTLPPHRPANKALIGTKPCVFWQQGKCARGDKCTFRHDD